MLPRCTGCAGSQLQQQQQAVFAVAPAEQLQQCGIDGHVSGKSGSNHRSNSSNRDSKSTAAKAARSPTTAVNMENLCIPRVCQLAWQAGIAWEGKGHQTGCPARRAQHLITATQPAAFKTATHRLMPSRQSQTTQSPCTHMPGMITSMPPIFPTNVQASRCPTPSPHLRRRRAPRIRTPPSSSPIPRCPSPPKVNPAQAAASRAP